MALVLGVKMSPCSLPFEGQRRVGSGLDFDQVSVRRPVLLDVADAADECVRSVSIPRAI